MRKIWSLFVIAVLLMSLVFVAVQAEDWEEEDVSLDALLNPPTLPPDPDAPPAPTP